MAHENEICARSINLARVVHLGERLLHAVVEYLARFGQAQWALAAREKRATQLVLEDLHLTARRRLGDMGALSRMCEVDSFGYRYERFDLLQERGVSRAFPP